MSESIYLLLAPFYCLNSQKSVKLNYLKIHINACIHRILNTLGMEHERYLLIILKALINNFTHIWCVLLASDQNFPPIFNTDAKNKLLLYIIFGSSKLHYQFSVWRDAKKSKNQSHKSFEYSSGVKNRNIGPKEQKMSPSKPWAYQTLWMKILLEKLMECNNKCIPLLKIK